MELFPALCMFVSYEALSGTMFASYLCLTELFLTLCMFVSYEALSGTNARTTGLQNLMEATLGHEQPQSRGTTQSSYPPFNTY